ncbi:hypothetical protein GCM10011578_034770 [Streptomyces fuscichromogenes]|uniref:Uncharacterized protein n=1 Tax=Streptomyces fuscichromogenes TaxID=1324013 RepID=A0A918CRK8_9ACTN|nr:hypothetical protein GCM10011578_034770 [Streptomyces fuscichromogenes]
MPAAPVKFAVGGGAELARTPGCRRAGWTAAIILRRSVASSRARLKLVDSCWYSVPWPAM